MSVAQDLQHALRRLRREPAFAVASTTMLGIGIGVAASMFSIVNDVLLRPLPYDHPDRIVAVSATDATGGHPAAALPDFEALRDGARTFQSLAAYYHRALNLTGNDQPERLQGLAVSSTIFDVLGVGPSIGRPFTASDEAWGSHRVAILTDALWRETFDADPHVVGRMISLNGEAYRVVGVLPRDFWFVDAGDRLLVPLAFEPNDSHRTRANHFLTLLGRLEPSMTPETAAADATAIARGLAQDAPSLRGVSMAVTPLQDVVVSNVRTAMLVLAGAVVLLLVIGGINLTGVALARAVARRQQMAVQQALGATRFRLIRESLVESASVALPAGGLGALFAYGVTRVVQSTNPAILPRATGVTLDTRVLIFAASVSTLMALLIGIVPLLTNRARDLVSSLNPEARAGTSRAHARARTALVIAQTALAVVVLASGGLMLRSLRQLTQVDLGFDPSHVLTFGVSLPAGRYLDGSVHPAYVPEATRRADAYLRDSVERLRGIPGVKSVGATALLPASGIGWDKVATLWDRPLPQDVSQLPQFEYRPVSGDYFSAMGIPVIAGRALVGSDTIDSPLVAVVNREFVRRHFGGRNDAAIGTRVSVNPPRRLLPAAAISPDTPEMPAQFTIVGVVADARNASVTQAAAPMIYCPYSQGAEDTLSMTFVVRTTGDPLAILPGVRRAMARADREQPLANIRTMDDALAASIGRPKVETEMLATFGIAAVALAALGVYALIAFSVAQRTRELGIRVALGARPAALGLAVIGHGVALALIGVLLGSAAAVVAVRAMRTMVFGISVLDPAVFIIVAALLIVAAAAAAVFPAVRAARVNPLTALR